MKNKLDSQENTMENTRIDSKYFRISMSIIALGLLAFLFADHPNVIAISNGSDFLELIRWSLNHLGFFVAVSVASHLIYLGSLKREERRSINDYLKEIERRTRDYFSNVIERVGCFSNHGLHAIHEKIDLFNLIDDLDSDNELSILFTYWPDVNQFSTLIKKGIEKGVTFRILAIEPLSDGVIYRAKETNFDEEQIKAGVTNFSNLLKDIKESHGDSFDYRFYNSPPCIPIFLVRKRVGETYESVRTYTGFYLTKAAKDTLHMEWDKPDGIQDNNEKNIARFFLDDLAEYFEARWNLSKADGEIIVAGNWNYEMTEEKDTNIKKWGTCTIRQTGRKLSISGERKECSVKDDSNKQGGYERVECTVLPWESTWAWLCNDGIIRFDYYLKPKGNQQVSSFCKVEPKQSTTEDTIQTLEGTYAIYGPYESLDTRTGKIVFTRKDSRSIH